MELLRKGKKKASDKILKPDKDFGSVWVKIYRDVYAIIWEWDNSEQFKQKLHIIKVRIWEANKKLITLLKEVRIS